MTDDDLKKIGDEFVRVLNPVYQQLDRIEGTLSKHSKTLEDHTKLLNEHTEKIDALTAEMHDLKQEFRANGDKTNSEIDNIKDFVGLNSHHS